MKVGASPLPEELIAAYRRDQLDRGRKPKVPLTREQQAKRERARAKRKRKSR